MKSDLENMSLSELQDLREEVDKEIRKARDREREQVKRDLQSLARERGYSLDELFQGGQKKSKAKPKYRNPDNPEQTWSGRGRRPKWIEESGRDLEDFLIDKN
jgi:DNA-binding protein H-NS